MKIKSLSSKLLCTKCSAKSLDFKTTNDLAELHEPIGQERAIAAIGLGIHIQQTGYNLFLLGPKGTGKYNLINSVLEYEARHKPTPSDWCYIHNFSNPQKPLALELPPGLGPVLQRDMDLLIDELRTEIPAILDSVEFRAQAQKLEEELKNRQEDELKKIDARAQDKSLTIVTTPRGFVVTPMQNGKPMTNKEMDQLPKQELDQKQQQINSIRDELTEMLEELPRWHKEKHDKQKVLRKEFTSVVVGRLVGQLKQKYQDQDGVIQFLQTLANDMMENPQVFYPNEKKAQIELSFIKYKINVLVSHSPDAGAPVVYEDHPSHSNLLGCSEYMAELGTFITNFTLIRSGALHQANGGYLILDARQLLTQPYAWESIKRILYAKKITIESLGQAMGFPSTVSLEPEPIPLKIKIILLGERSLYYMLCEHDDNFPDLFKIAADFSNHIPRTPENLILFARLLATLVKKSKLLPLNHHAVAKVIEHSCRISGDSQRLSIFLRFLEDLLSEANFWAVKEKHSVIKAVDIQKAIDQQIYRSNRMQTRISEDYRRQLLLVDTKGKKVGHVNGLSVLQIGHYAFGCPSRITATVRLGKGEVVDIEREVDLGGALHSKGVFILSGFLHGRYLVDHHLSIFASLVFEQNYGEVEGDSASAGELAALLSAIAQLPIKQSLAITGSVNQYGQIQPIGNVNEKIEGFFSVCRMQGLTKHQGVIIPAANVQHLMLNEEVVQAARKKLFSVYAVETIDQVMTLLTGYQAGKANKEGHFPENTVNGMIEAKLRQYAELSEGHHKEESGNDSN